MALALLIAASLSAHPAQLVLGKDPGADLEVRAPAAAKVTFSTSVGTVTGAQRQGDVVRARFNAPPLRAPSVALILAQIDDGSDRELQWISIPLFGSDTMVIETRPGSRVEASNGGRVLGAGPAGEDGTARLAMVVPPGVRQATLKIIDKLGNANEKPLDLDPPPYSRVRLAAHGDAATPGDALEVEIFVVKPDGTPDDDAKLALTADEGETSVRKRTGSGVYLARYVPADGQSGTVRLEVKANGQLATLDVAVRAQPPGGGGSLWRSSLDPDRPWSMSAGLLGGLGGTFDGATAGSVIAEFATRIRSTPFEGFVDFGGNFLSAIPQYGGGSAALAEQSQAHAWLAQIGARASYAVLRWMDLHGSLAVGLQNQHVRTTLPLNLGQFEDSGISTRLALAAGVSSRIGPGRALAQVQLEWAASRIAGYAGSTSGVQGTIGYLVTVR